MNAAISGMSALHKHSAAPLYQQIKDDISAKVRSGEWAAGEKLPSENELVELLSVSRMTVHRALRELTQEGLLNRVHGVGTFVAEASRHASLIRLQDIADEIRAEGRVYSTQVLLQKRENADAVVAQSMGLEIGAPIDHLRTVHLRDGVPVQLENRYVNPQLAPAFIDQDFTHQTSTHYLVNLFRPDEMEHVVRAILPDDTMAKQLSLTGTEPCLQLTRRTWKEGAVVTIAFLIYPGSRYHLGERYFTSGL